MPPMDKDTETKTSLNFTVTRSEPELVLPAKPTPRELKQLSSLDDQQKLRCVIPIVQFYRYDPSMKGKDPAGVIRDALARALVIYYPIAGRLVEARDRKLYVDCTGEGVWFVEADADVELAQLGDPPLPPFSWVEHVLPDVPASEMIIDSPLYFFQVTRLKCGGFVLAFYVNHIVSDASGFGQFLTAVGEIAQGAETPSVTPIWSRELFSNAPQPHPPTLTNHKDEKVKQPTSIRNPFGNTDVICRSFFFGPSELSTIRGLVSDHLRPHSTTFEILTACLWRCRTTALQLDPKDVTLLVVSVNARDRANRVVPAGYYGNAVVVSVTGTTAKDLHEGSIEYATGFVKKAKEEGTKECMTWRTNPPTVKYPSRSVPLENFFCVSDLRRLGLSDVDFGSGKPVYSGVAKFGFLSPTYYTSRVDRNGNEGVVVSLCLGAKAMGRFETELNNVLSQD